MNRWIWVAVIAGLVPWGAAAIFTNWFNEVQPNGVQSLSQDHALVLVMLQLGIGLLIGLTLGRKR